MNIPLDRIICHDVTKPFPLPDESIDCVITSPPYWSLRDYGIKNQIGLESHPQEYIDKLVEIYREVKRVLKKTGSFYLNIGDTYFGGKGKSGSEEPDEFTLRKKQGLMQGKASTYQGDRASDICRQDKGWLKPKQLMLIPSRVAIALQEDGWTLRNDIIWYKPNPMPSPVKDRLNNTFEHVFHFVKNKKYYYDLNAIRIPHKMDSIKRACRGRQSSKLDSKQYAIHYKEEYRGYDNMQENFEGGKLRAVHPNGKNPGDFWSITTKGFKGAHFAVFPEELIKKPLKASCPEQVCKKCGKPREKLWKKPDMTKRPKRSDDAKTAIDEHLGFKDRSAGQKYQDWRNNNPDKIIGYTDCNCNAGFEPGIVLDPFCGRGTIGKVAKELGLHYILFDIKPEYCELARLYIGGQKYKVPKTQKNLDPFA